MLVLGRKEEQTIQIGDDIQITILKVQGSSVRVGIKAPDSVTILRGELESCHRNWDAGISFDLQQPPSAVASCK